MTALTDLQNVLTEFYAQSSSPERLSQLQQYLIHFEQEPSSWKLAIQFLSSSNDQYVCMFSLGVLDTTIRRRWAHLTDPDKEELSLFIQKYVFATDAFQNISLMSVLKSKATKIWASACKQNFSRCHSGFLEKLETLLQMPESVTSEEDLQSMALSLALFKAAFDEAVRPDCELGAAKVSENIRLIGQSAPRFFSALSEIGEKLIGSEFTGCVNNLFSCSGAVSEAQFYSSLRHILCFNANILFTADDGKKKLSASLLTLLCGVLGCFNTLLGVVSITAIDHVRLYSLLYIFAVMGSPKTISALVGASRPRNLTPISSVGALSEIGILSLSCLAEIVERKDVRREDIVQHLSYIFRLLYWDMLLEDDRFPLSNLATSVIDMLADSGASLSTAASANNLSGLASLSQSVESTSEDFYQRLADLLRLLVTNFLFFFKNDNLDPAVADCQSPFTFTPSSFLLRVHFFTFTTCRSILPVYLSCLEMWTSYLDFIKAIYYGDSYTGGGKKVTLPQQTQDTISQLCASLLSTIYFSESANYLDALDNDDPQGTRNRGCTDIADSYVSFFDDSLQRADSNDLMADPSELGQFMQASLTILSSISSFNPKDVLFSVAAKLQEGMNVFSQLSSCDKVALEEHTTRKLHSLLQDLATCLNCLAYLSEHFGALPDGNMLHWLLQALVFNLGAGVALCDRLTIFREETIRQDVVQVVVENINLIRCLLASGFVIVSENADDDKNNAGLPSGSVCLGIADKDSLSTTLLQCVHRLFLKSPINTLKLAAAQLLQGIVVSANPPGFLPPANLLSSEECLGELMSCCFDAARLQTFTIPVQRLLVRTVTAYLLIDEAPSSSKLHNNPKRLEQLQALSVVKRNILDTQLVPVFIQALQQENLTTNRDAYFAGLCWLNEALASLAPLGSGSRRVLYDCLLSSGLLERIWQCLESASPSLHSESHLFVAHLSFFVQFTDIYGGQKTTASLIPNFIATVMRLLQMMEQNTASARLVSPIMSHLVHLITVLVHNRSVFSSVAPDVLRFVCNCLVVNLAGGGLATDLGSVVAAASRNDPDLCLHAFDVLFQAMSFGFAQLSNEANLDTFLRTVLAVFSPGVFDSRLITTCVDSLCQLNQRHRIFALPAFLTKWRAPFTRSFLTLLTTAGGPAQPGGDAEAALIRGLHAVFLAMGSEVFNAEDFWSSGLYPFLAEVLSLPAEKTQHFSQLAAAFAPQNGFTQINLNRVDEFSGILSTFLSELRLWLRDNSCSQAGW